MSVSDTAGAQPPRRNIAAGLRFHPTRDTLFALIAYLRVVGALSQRPRRQTGGQR